MSEETIRTIRPEWSKVMDGLLLVNLHVTRWRAATRAEFEEFGLDAAAFKAYTAGARRLLPRHIHDELEKLERMARTLLVKYSYKTLFGCLMPKERYEDFKARLTERPAAELRWYLHGKRDGPPAWDTTSVRERWYALAREIAANRAWIVDNVVDSYRPSAIVRWRIENRLPKDSEVTPDDAWLDDILSAMVNHIPTAEAIEASFEMSIIPAFVETPDEAIKATKLEQIAEKEAELDSRLAELDYIHLDGERQREQMAIQAERERLARERRITEEVMAAEKAARTEKIDKTLDDVAGQLHTLVYSAVCDGLAQVQDKGKVHARWIGRVKDLVEQVRLLNFTDDGELNRVCRELEVLAESNAATEASADRVRDVLTQVGVSVRADLVAAGIPTRSARDLGIPDEPTPDLIRQVRRNARRDLFSQETPDVQETPITVKRAARVLEPTAAR